MKDRILFEDIPAGTEYIQTVIDAMQQGRVLRIDYQPFGSPIATYRFNPYAMKVYRQRWYVLGYLHEHEGLRNISLDRTINMEISDENFTMPKDFYASEYYAHTVGIFVNDQLKPQKVVVRAYGLHVEYMRSLPLHSSQREIATTAEYSDFEYVLCLTPELATHLLAMGEKAEVIRPKTLRDTVKKRLEQTLRLYSQLEDKTC